MENQITWENLMEATKAAVTACGESLGHLKADIDIRENKMKVAIAGLAVLTVGSITYLAIRQHSQNKRIAELEKSAQTINVEINE